MEKYSNTKAEQDFTKVMEDFMLCHSSLFADIKIIEQQIEINDNQTWRRLLIKQMVSTMETQIEYLRTNVKYYNDSLSEKEELKLFRKNIEKGKHIKQSILENIVFSFELFSSVNYSFLTINKNSKEYSRLVKLIKTRNKITHPAKLEDINVTDTDYEICKSAFYTFQNSFITILEKSANSIMQQIQGIEEFLSKNKTAANSG